MMVASLTHNVFAELVNTKFRVQLDENKTGETELVEVSELLTSPHQERFSIVFRGPNEMQLGQGMRRFEHDGMGDFDLFIVPIRQDEQGLYYEAVFNRFRGHDQERPVS